MGVMVKVVRLNQNSKGTGRPSKTARKMLHRSEGNCKVG